MMFMRPCEDFAFRIDIAVRRPWRSRRVPAIAFEDVDVDQLYRIVLAQGLPQAAETLRAKNATGKKLSVLDADDLRTFYQVPGYEATLLMQAIQQWTAQGVPPQDIDAAAPVSPLHSMSEQLWTIIRAVANALPQQVIPSCQWLVLSPAMIAEQGLPMDDRQDVGWPFDEVIEARQRRCNLLCARTKHRVNYQEYFEAADMGHSVVDASAHAQRSTSSEQKASVASPSAPTTSVSMQVCSQRKEPHPEDAQPHVDTGAHIPRPDSPAATSSVPAAIPTSDSAAVLTSRSPSAVVSTS